MPTATQNITELLTAAQDGDQEAANELFGIVYQELRQMARHYLRQERPNHTLQATALVHEVYLRLFNGQKAEIENRAHFFGIAAAQMRRILVDHARRKQARRRDAAQGQGTFLELSETSAMSAEELITLNEALTELVRHYPRAGRVVELRFFGGVLAGVIDQDAAHDVCRDAEEMGAVLPFYVFLVDQFKIRFVHQRRRIQRLARIFATHLLCRQSPQLVVH